jgi:formate dehydrogenase iron-sulfur subunit
MPSGFLTDSTVCIGCKACEVACKEWNGVPHDGFVWHGSMSYDHTACLGHSTWRHVKFVEHERNGQPAWDFHPTCASTARTPVPRGLSHGIDRPHRVRRRLHPARRLQRLRLLHRRLPVRGGRSSAGRRAGVQVHVLLRPAEGGVAASVRDRLPAESIQFGDLDELRARADARVADLHARGMTDAVVYDPRHTSVGGTHAIFLVRGAPEAYNLPVNPEWPGIRLGDAWRSAGMASAGILLLTTLAFWFA